MDGICIQFEDFEKGQRRFKIVGTQPAGAKAMENQRGCAIEIMTGAMLARHADSVIRYEDMSIEMVSQHSIDDVRQGQNVTNKVPIEKREMSYSQNSLKLLPTEIGVLATVGKANSAGIYKPEGCHC